MYTLPYYDKARMEEASETEPQPKKINQKMREIKSGRHTHTQRKNCSTTNNLLNRLLS